MRNGSRATDPTFGSALPVSPQMNARVVAPICRVLARSSSRCPVILLTAIYYVARKALKAPAKDLPKVCAIAFVNSPDHYTPGWTNLTTPIFGSDLPRSAHVVKIAAGLKESGNATIVYVDFKELEFHPFDGIACANLINPGMDFAVTRHPLHATRTVDEEIMATIYKMSRRVAPYNVFADLIHQREYMDSFAYVMNRSPDPYHARHALPSVAANDWGAYLCGIVAPRSDHQVDARAGQL